MRPYAALACMILIPVLAAGAPGAAQQSEILEVSSRSLTDAQFLAADGTAGTPVTLTGRLHLPGTDAPYPAVVLRGKQPSGYNPRKQREISAARPSRERVSRRRWRRNGNWGLTLSGA